MIVNIEMPRYKSHKMVWALKIGSLEVHADGSATITPENKSYASFKTRPKWAERFEGSKDDKGYFVQYKDGFTSWSPTEAFENGYSRISD